MTPLTRKWPNSSHPAGPKAPSRSTGGAAWKLDIGDPLTWPGPAPKVLPRLPRLPSLMSKGQNMGFSGGPTRVICLLTGLLGVGLLAPGPPALADASWAQLGAKSLDSRSTTGVRSLIFEPPLSSPYPGGTPYKFYWVGTFLQSGTFYQAGISDPPLDSECVGLKWFVQAYDSSGNQVLDSSGGCGLTGNHTFALERTSDHWGTKWIATLSSVQLPGSDLYVTSGTYALGNKAYAVTEAYRTCATAPCFGAGSYPGFQKVDYSPAVRLRVSSSWVDPAHGEAYLANDAPKFITPCRPYVVENTGDNSVRTYSSTTSGSCLVNASPLW